MYGFNSDKSKGEITKSTVGLGNVDNTADANKSVASAGKLTTARTIDGIEFDGSAAITHYGTCSTAADTGEKVVTCPGFKLVTGALVWVSFTYTNTVSGVNFKLNVNGTGAKSVYTWGSSLIGDPDMISNKVVGFVYNGTAYKMIGAYDPYSVESELISLGVATTIDAGAMVNLEFTYATALPDVLNNPTIRNITLQDGNFARVPLCICGWFVSTDKATVTVYNPTNSAITLDKTGTYITVQHLEKWAK